MPVVTAEVVLDPKESGPVVTGSEVKPLAPVPMTELLAAAAPLAAPANQCIKRGPLEVGRTYTYIPKTGFSQNYRRRTDNQLVIEKPVGGEGCCVLCPVIGCIWLLDMPSGYLVFDDSSRRVRYLSAPGGLFCPL